MKNFISVLVFIAIWLPIQIITGFDIVSMIGAVVPSLLMVIGVIGIQDSTNVKRD